MPMAGDESDRWHPLVEDFVLVAQKLEGLGFGYHRGNIIIAELSYGGAVKCRAPLRPME